MSSFSLRKNEILRSKKEIDSLFKNPNIIFKYPFKLYFRSFKSVDNNDIPIRFAISIPKKNIKKAVQRNLLKRRSREAYRLNKHLLEKLNEEKIEINLMFVYIATKVETFEIINKSISYILNELLNEWSE